MAMWEAHGAENLLLTIPDPRNINNYLIYFLENDSPLVAVSFAAPGN